MLAEQPTDRRTFAPLNTAETRKSSVLCDIELVSETDALTPGGSAVVCNVQ